MYIRVYKKQIEERGRFVHIGVQGDWSPEIFISRLISLWIFLLKMFNNPEMNAPVTTSGKPEYSL